MQINLASASKIGFLLLVHSVSAQSFFGLQNSNYGGIHTAVTNPSLITMMDYQRSANISTIGFSAENNYVSLETPFSAWQLLRGKVPQQYKKADGSSGEGSIDWQSSWLKEDRNGDNINANLNLEYRGPSYANHYGRLIWGLGMRTKYTANLDGITPEMIGWAKNLIDSQSINNINQISAQKFSVFVNSYQEYSGLLAIRIVDNAKVKLGIGTNLKLILGNGNFKLQNSGVLLNVKGIDSIGISGGQMQVSYTENNLFQQLSGGVLAGSLPRFRDISGVGYGFDLGFTLLLGDNMTKTKKDRSKVKDYRMKIAAALLDLGRIGYSNKNQGFIIDGSKNFSIPIQTPEFILAASKGVNSVVDYTKEKAIQDGAYINQPEEVKIILPTTLQLQFDYQVVSMFNVAAQLTQAIDLNNPYQIQSNSSLVVVPRFEHAWFELSAPISLYNNYRSFGFGGFLRLGPVFLGTDNIIKSINPSKLQGVNFYFGISTLLR